MSAGSRFGAETQPVQVAPGMSAAESQHDGLEVVAGREVAQQQAVLIVRLGQVLYVREAATNGRACARV
jgi:anthranilate phosphoribosyltransferase